jgi:hypothetical protein
MKLTYLILFIFHMMYSTMVIAGVLLGHLTFGHGLGDIYFLAGIFIITIVIGLGRFVYNRMDEMRRHYISIYFSIFIVLFVIYSLVELTWDRGPEYPWDGNLMIDNTPPDMQNATIERFEDEK